MSYIEDFKAFYPKTWQQRLAITRYRTCCEFEGEPKCVTIHQLYSRYGGPEEGGWWYNEGFPEKTHHVFSKKQAIKTYLSYAQEYKIYEQPNLGDSTTDSVWELCYSTEPAEHYPTERPYYC